MTLHCFEVGGRGGVRVQSSGLRLGSCRFSVVRFRGKNERQVGQAEVADAG